MTLLLATLAWAARARPAPPPAEPPPTPEAPVAPEGPDRSRPPDVTPPSLLPLPEPDVHAIAPGVDAWVVNVPGARHLEVQVWVGAGQSPRGAAQWHAIGATTNLATATRDEADLSAFEALHAADVYVQGLNASGCVGLDVSREEAHAGWTLLSDVLHASEPGAADVQRYAADTRRWLTLEAPASAAETAAAALDHAWFPATHPQGERPDLSAYAALSARGVKAAYEAWLRSAPVHVLIVGDVRWPDVEAEARAAVDGLGRDVARATPIAYTPPARTRVVAVDMPGQAQTAIRLRMAAPAAGAPERTAYQATQWVLGGHFLSRLNRDLREDKGYTYGVDSTYSVDAAGGATTVQVDVPTAHTADAIRAIEADISALAATGATEGELVMAYRAMAADWNSTLQTASSAQARYAALIEAGEPLDAQRARTAAVARLTPADTIAAAQAWLGADRPRLWVLVGDRATIAPQLDALGWTTEWITPAAAVMGGF